MVGTYLRGQKAVDKNWNGGTNPTLVAIISEDGVVVRASKDRRSWRSSSI